MKVSDVTVRHIKAARALLGWSQQELADRAKLGIATVKLREAAEGKIGGEPGTAQKIVAALEAAGVVFSNGASPGVKLKARRG